MRTHFVISFFLIAAITYVMAVYYRRIKGNRYPRRYFWGDKCCFTAKNINKSATKFGCFCVLILIYCFREATIWGRKKN